ncbi:adenosylcobinamide amidohydrolase [Paenibacillus xanthanilyticus]|uniref:Adenosylcobinamide amidohydrolase n=1 Tax=Paenibacillus xanthanilyticus TaxID=1783531 RepID=A0ABV8KBQ2_9BACL
MSQPFRGEGVHHRAALWPELDIRFVDGDHILVRSDRLLETVSSAVYGGGRGRADHFVNRKVPLSYNERDPVLDLGAMIRGRDYKADSTVGLLTAAKLTHASVVEAAGDRFNALCISTAGIGNAARAGVERPVFPAYAAGTINTFIFVDGHMSEAAMIGALITATEAKAAALQDLDVLDPLDGRQATGTTTDSVVIAVSQSGRFKASHAYCGAATSIGNLLGRMVYDTVHEAVRTSGEK